jgi:hypothetical protein
MPRPLHVAFDVLPGAAHTPFNVQLQLPVLGASASIIGSEFPTTPTVGGSDLRLAPPRCPKPSSALPPVADRGEKKWTARLAPTITDVSGISL